MNSLLIAVAITCQIKPTTHIYPGNLEAGQQQCVRKVLECVQAERKKIKDEMSALIRCLK